ncbi:hypothetical protein L3Q82_014056, partial [Scortum barcoo]
MALNHSSCWHSILEKVKNHLPTIDFDSSSADNEEVVSIYQRPAGLSLKVPEDFDSFSMDDDEVEELSDPVAETCWSEETCTVKSDDETVRGAAAAQRGDTGVEVAARERGVVEFNGAKLDVNKADKSDKCFPVLSLARLDQWDLDEVLQNLREDGPSLRSAEPVETHTDGDKDRSQSNIMEKLVAFCERQSYKSVSEPLKSQNHIRENTVWNKSMERELEAELQLSHQECPTVYIDLRCPDPSIKPQRTSPNLSSGSKSPAKHNSHQETPPAKKPNLKAHTGSRTGDSEQQGQQVKQTSQQHKHIRKKLEIHRPTKSVDQKEPAAERTDVLYDSEASHLQTISTLPAGMESNTCMVLIVSLSSPGMVADRTRGKKKHLYPAATKAHIYNTLVAWFLSLVGPDLRHDEAGVKVPFWVAGLQQMWTDGGLALHVLVVAHDSYKLGVKKKKSKQKKNTYTIKGTSIHLYITLSAGSFFETSFTQIGHWLPRLKTMLDQGALPVPLPSTCLNDFISVTSSKKVIDRAFGLSPGFYWQTVETQECVCKGRETTQELHTQSVSVALGYKAFFLHPLITHYTLQLVQDSGLNLCGLRLLYPPQGFLSDSAGAVAVIQRTDEACQPVLALAVRGPHAHSVWKDLTSSLDPLLLRKTDPTSVSCLHVRRQDRPLLHSPRLATRVHRELCLWFSGRLQGESVQRFVPPDNRVGVRPLSLHRQPSSLCATTKAALLIPLYPYIADLLLVVSPGVPPRCYGQVLAVCERRGFGLGGLQRLQLQSHGAAILGLTSQQAHVFCSPHTVNQDQEEVELPSHCLVLLLRKENAVYHSLSLPAALMREFKAQKLLGCIHCRLDGVHTVDPSFCFHVVPYSSHLYHIFVRCMWAVPDPSGVILSHPRRSSNSDVEQVVILTLSGKDMSQGLSLLHRALTEGPEGGYGQDALASLRKLLPHDYPGNLSVLTSPTPEVALRQASLIFFEHEMIPDPQMLLTVCLFKPRVWYHALVKIVHKLQLSGLTLVGLRVVTLDRSSAALLLPAETDPSDLGAHVEYLCSGSSLALCLEGENAVRRLLGVLDREDSSPWTTCYGTAHSHRGVYGSGSYQKAIQDVKSLFPEGLCCTETSTMRQEQILSMCSDPLASVEREQTCTLAPVERLTPPMSSGPNEDTPPLSQVPSQLDMLEQLLRSGCHLVAGRMSTLDNEQKKHIAEILKASSRRDERTPPISTAPCLITALQGETIVTCFDLILESIYKERSELERVGKTIIYPGSETE